MYYGALPMEKTAHQRKFLDLIIFPLKICCRPPGNMPQLMHHAANSVLPPSEGVMPPSKPIMPPLDGMIPPSKNAAFQKYVTVPPSEGITPPSERSCLCLLPSIWRPHIIRSSDVGETGHVLSWGTFCQWSFLEKYPV